MNKELILKELELREREIALKEKELELRMLEEEQKEYENEYNMSYMVSYYNNGAGSFSAERKFGAKSLSII